MPGRPFEAGNKKGPGRPPGSRNKKTVFCKLIEGHGEAIITQSLVQAMKGNSRALKLMMDRLMPPCRPAQNRFRMPPVRTAADLALAFQTVMQQVALARLSPQDAAAIGSLLENRRRAIETEEFSSRLQSIEEKIGGIPPNKG